MGSLKQLAAVAALSLTAAACASAPPPAFHDYASRREALPRGAHIEYPDRPLQCVAYARRISGIGIYGDAWTWWDQTAGRYEHFYEPQPGALLVLDGYAGPHRAHLAVVRSITSSGEIRIDHANWLDHGNIYLDDPVIDVSADHDWSEVRVYNLKAHAWGGHIYHVRGFIGTERVDNGDRYAEND